MRSVYNGRQLGDDLLGSSLQDDRRSVVVSWEKSIVSVGNKPDFCWTLSLSSYFDQSIDTAGWRSFYVSSQQQSHHFSDLFLRFIMRVLKQIK